MEPTFNAEESRILIKTILSRNQVLQNEILYEKKEKICRNYAYDIPCPDMIEFGDCQYVHDELIK